MIQILDKSLLLDLPLEAGLPLLVAQIPTALVVEGMHYRLKEPEENWRTVRSILELAASRGGESRYSFLLFPESVIPQDRLEELVGFAGRSLPDNTVVIAGLEHIPLSRFAALLKEHVEDNAEILQAVRKDLESEDPARPVNVCAILARENTGRVRVFFFAKTHPFFGEEALDPYHDLYRGRFFLLFRCAPVSFNFLPLLCFDYVYRDSRNSNILDIINRANQLYFKRRQQVDLLAIVQCNPKPEHRVFRDVLTGFYGEFLFRTPGVRDSATVFVNSSNETEMDGVKEPGSFGHSSIVVSQRHKLPRINLSEFRTDDFAGAPVCRLRFGASTRLFSCRLFPYHEIDPRASRSVLKVTGIFQPDGQGGWTRFSGDDLVAGAEEEERSPFHVY